MLHRQLTRRKPSFDEFRSQFADPSGSPEVLGRGRGIISNSIQLNQYLHVYGKMIYSQWQIALEGLSAGQGAFDYTDYGCGQGLAGIILNDILGHRLFEEARSVTLVDASKAALVRAEAVYRCLAPKAEIRCVARDLAELSTEDLGHKGDVLNIHIFSNVLDIDGFDNLELFGKFLNPGAHEILVVSNDRDVEGGARPIQELKNKIEDPKFRAYVPFITSSFKRFRCTNPSQSEAISWVAVMDVKNV